MIIPPVSLLKQGVFLCLNNRNPYFAVGLGRVLRGSGVHFNVVVAAQTVLGAVGEPFVPYPCVHVLERLGQRTVAGENCPCACGYLPCLVSLGDFLPGVIVICNEIVEMLRIAVKADARTYRGQCCCPTYAPARTSVSPCRSFPY